MTSYLYWKATVLYLSLIHIFALNRFLEFIGIPECKVKLNKIQRKIFGDETKEITKEEYERLLLAAKSKHNERLFVLLQTICSTGIRVSEHQYITVEALKCCKVSVNNKDVYKRQMVYKVVDNISAIPLSLQITVTLLACFAGKRVSGSMI